MGQTGEVKTNACTFFLGVGKKFIPVIIRGYTGAFGGYSPPVPFRPRIARFIHPTDHLLPVSVITPCPDGDAYGTQALRQRLIPQHYQWLACHEQLILNQMLCRCRS